MTYKESIEKEMYKLAGIYNTIFLGQQVGVTDFYGTLNRVPISKRIELPVAEELQLGMSIGLALEGYLPISVFQRIDFLPRACDQLVNHLDILKELSAGKFNPKVIIRTSVGATDPLDTGLQHSKDLTKGFNALLKMPVIAVKTPEEVHKAYKHAFFGDESIIIVEYQNLFKE